MVKRLQEKAAQWGLGPAQGWSWCRVDRGLGHVQGDGAMSKCTEDRGSQASQLEKR